METLIKICELHTTELKKKIERYESRTIIYELFGGNGLLY